MKITPIVCHESKAENKSLINISLSFFEDDGISDPDPAIKNPEKVHPHRPLMDNIFLDQKQFAKVYTILREP